ncbi:hypothetical protein [Streptomyces sp. SID13031]|uniref:hypothetical protein n=1 Tax=Streptomyces sp. SID13031 TaxID=2706046 RepID=UPI0013CB73FC|nr:hypothetical protein [Streptomyces sp. SID13031]NEA33786.1 hypothetical protein [Streptomyces sp. SID13031]
MAVDYKVTRQDSSDAFVVGAHLWRVQVNGRKDRTLNTLELQHLAGSSARVRLPQPPTTFYGLSAELPIDPYPRGKAYLASI